MGKARRSAGLLLFRIGVGGGVELLLVHPGGPFWAHKDAGSWSVAKGEAEGSEEEAALLDVARREFFEETGFAPEGEFLPLGAVRQPGGKQVHVWAVRGDFDPARLVSNTFRMEWPKGSGTLRAFPEVDRAAWFDVATARRKILKGQLPFIDRLMARLTGS
jgi:predicted NUDIX family NTP pyrophosphohydrolase